jgi:hypothetical protein
MAKPTPLRDFSLQPVTTKADESGGPELVKAQKITALCLMVMVVLFTFITGCSSASTTTEPTSTATSVNTGPFTLQELEQLAVDSLAVTQQAVTIKVNLDTTNKVTTGGDSNANVTGIKAKATLNEKQNQMEMNATLTTNNAGAGDQTAAITIYVLADFAYIKANVPPLGEQWVKTPVTAGILNNFGAGMAQEDLDILETYKSIEYVDSAELNGTACYIIRVVPDNAFLLKYAKEQAGRNTDINWDKIQDASKLYRSAFFTFWIAKDSRYVQKLEINTILDLPDKAKTTTDIHGTVEFYDYNVPVTITLPDQAANALEVPAELFSGQ